LPSKVRSIEHFFFQKKKQKAFVLLRRRSHYPTLGEADPGSLRACRQKINSFNRPQKKEAKSVVPLRGIVEFGAFVIEY
jgi:hypothetical protein